MYFLELITLGSDGASQIVMSYLDEVPSQLNIIGKVCQCMLTVFNYSLPIAGSM